MYLLIVILFVCSCSFASFSDQSLDEIVSIERASITNRSLCSTEFNNEFKRVISESIKQKDPTVDEKIIECLYWEAFKNSKALSGINGDAGNAANECFEIDIKPFVLRKLQEESPPDKTYKVAGVFCGDDEEVIGLLVQHSQKDNDRLANVIGAFVAGGVDHEKAKNIILLSLASKEQHIILLATQYLQQYPIPEALPLLIKQYQCSNESLNFDPKVRDRNSDIWRSLVGKTILKYKKEEIIPFSEQIQYVSNSIDLGRASSRVHGKLERICGIDTQSTP